MHMCMLSHFIRVRLCATLWRDITCVPCISCVPGGFFTIEPPGKTKRPYNQFLFCWKPSWWHESLQALTKQFQQHCKIIQVTDSIQKWLLWGVRCRKSLQLHDLLIAFKLDTSSDLMPCVFCNTIATTQEKKNNKNTHGSETCNSSWKTLAFAINASWGKG